MYWVQVFVALLLAACVHVTLPPAHENSDFALHPLALLMVMWV